MATENTQQEQVQGTENLLDFSEFLGGQQQSAPPEQAAPQEGQQQQEEFVDAEGEQIPSTEIDNPKSYKFFQSKFTKEQQEKQKILEEKIRLEERLKAVTEKPVQQQAVLQRPKPIPPMPQGFNMIDATTDPNSSSAKWYEQKLNYDVEMANYNDYFINQVEQERTVRAQQEQVAHHKARAIQGFLESGTTPEEASKVYDWVVQMIQKDDPKFYVDFYRFMNGQNPQTQRKFDNFQKQGQQQGIPLPPTVAPSKAEPKEMDFGDIILNTAKKYRI